MALKVFWSPEADQELDTIFDYLLAEWNKKVVSTFARRIDSCIKTISEFPDSYPVTNKRKKLHRCILSKQSSLFYRVKNNEIEIVFLFDNRRSTSKLRKRMRRVK